MVLLSRPNSSKIMYRLILTLTFLLVAGERQVTQVSCTPPYLAVGGHCLLVDPSTSGNCTSPFVVVGDQCLFFSTFPEVSQQEARQTCHSLDGELAYINSATRLKNIIDYIHANGLGGMSYWIDGSDQKSEGQWFTSSGKPNPRGTPFWSASIGMQEPNGIIGENCLELMTQFAFYMNDIDCTLLRSSVCEKLNVTEKFAPPAPAQLDCPLFFVEVSGLCLSFMTWADQTWAEAKQSCHELGGELADLNDIEHLRAIYLYLHQEEFGEHSFWLGGSDAASEGVWTWTDGTSVPSGSPFWGIVAQNVQEPDGGTSENCLLLNAEGFHYFRDASCDLLRNPLCRYNFQ